MDREYLHGIEDRLEEIRADRDALRSTLAATEQQRDEEKAGAAQMRGALEWKGKYQGTSWVIEGLKIAADTANAILPGYPNMYEQAIEKINAALLPSSGRDFLERLERAEDFLHEIDTDEDGICLGFTLHAIGQYLKEMDGKIAASEAQKQREEMLGLLRRVDELQKVRINPAFDQYTDEQASAWGDDWTTTVANIDTYLKGGGKDA